MDAPILAIVYSDGAAADRYLADLAYQLRDAGTSVGGLVQRNSFVRDRTKCDMEVEEVLSGRLLKISENRGPHARGCRLDRAVLADAATLLMRAVETKPCALVVNKFGTIEAEGGGLRDVIAAALESGIPLIIGVPYRNLDQWRAFAGEFSRECVLPSNDVDQWLKAHGIIDNLSATFGDQKVLGKQLEMR